ncbi:MAG: site-specific recombinase [Burkholderiales bacterium]|nr:site-specific recombinase [Burkholderiales bacterium]
MSVPRDLPSLLDALDPEATQVERHLWLVALLDWVRGDRESVQTSLSRVQLFLDIVEERPALRERVQTWWQALLGTVDGTTLLADHGFAQRPVFLSEFFSRLLRKILPATPQTRDASELFSLLFPHAFDAEWLTLLDEATAERLARLLALPTGTTPSPWQQTLEEAITYCVSQIRAIGFAPELRLRMSAAAHEERPFHALVADFDAVCQALHQSPRNEAALEAAVQHFKERLDACRHAAASVYAHLDEHGISVDMVFRLRQLRERVLRVRELLDCLLTAAPAFSAAQLLGRLVLVGQQSRSLRALIASNSSLLAAKVTDRSAETGEHYITRNRAEYRDMLRKAAGGGAVMSLTTLVKFGLLTLGVSAFWSGFLAGMNYALSFVLVQLLHWTVATKQPAMTAPAMATKLKDLGAPEAVEQFVDEVTHLMRSQVAAIVGNLALVVPCVLLLCGALFALFGRAPLSLKEADHVLHSLTLFGPTALFAALTGVLLFASSIVAGWAENWFVLHRLDSALRYNPRITAALGSARAARWAGFLRINISGLAANISLGLMLGLIPAFATFFGLGLEVRHVTLSTGQLAAASATLGTSVLTLPAFWWCLTAVLVTGLLNVTVSFYFAFRLALRAHNVSGIDRARIRAAIAERIRSAPLSFFWPARETPQVPPPEEPEQHG